MSRHDLTSAARRRRMVLYLSRQSKPVSPEEPAAPAVQATPQPGPATPPVGQTKQRQAAQACRMENVSKKRLASPSVEPLPSIVPLPGRKRQQERRSQPAPHPGPARLPRRSSREHLDRLRTLLSERQPVSWVFCGDSLLSDTEDARDWISLVGQFAHHIRWKLRRFPDMFIDSSLPGGSIISVARDLDERVLRFRPQVVVVICGLSDAERGLAGLKEFEESLFRMLNELLDQGIVPVVNTPPCSHTVEESELPERLVFLEAIRSITAEQDVLLVDHWEHWEWSASQSTGLEHWYDADGRTPGKLGHQRIAGLLLEKLNLSKPEERHPSLEPRSSS